jgi:hypothetical protein
MEKEKNVNILNYSFIKMKLNKYFTSFSRCMVTKLPKIGLSIKTWLELMLIT